MKTTIKQTVLGIAAYLFATMSVQMLNHFVVNKAHYAAISFLRTEPIFPLGILSMLIQGAILAFLFPRVRGNRSSYAEGIKYALIMGLFFSSYSIFAEPAKYSVPSIRSWIAVEASASFAQFLLFGILLGMVFRNRSNESKRV